MKVNRPTCKKSVQWREESKFRPFCSERCQQVDFGSWATESYSIPAEPSEEWSESNTTSSNPESFANSSPYTLQ